MTPAPPCEQCRGLCCTGLTTQRSIAVELSPEEAAQFPEAITVLDRLGPILGLPLNAAGRCIHLTEQNRCSIYDRRPKLCRTFNCLYGYRVGKNRHSFFLEDHPELVTLIETMQPEYAALRIQEQAQRPEL